MSGAYKQPEKGKGMGMGKGKGKEKEKVQTKQRRSSGSDDGIGFGGKRNDPIWQCIQGCGACCKLDKGPAFAAPEEIFDNLSDVQVCHAHILFDKMLHPFFFFFVCVCSLYSPLMFLLLSPNLVPWIFLL